VDSTKVDDIYHDNGTSPSDAILVSDSEVDHGCSESSSTGTREGSLFLTLASPSSNASSLPVDPSSLTQSEMTSSGFSRKAPLGFVSDSTVNSTPAIIPEEWPSPLRHGLTLQKIQDPESISQPLTLSPKVDSSSDMDCDNTTDDQYSDSPMTLLPCPLTNEGPSNPVNGRNPSYVIPASTPKAAQSRSRRPPGLLAKVFASDQEGASSESESQHETSSDEDHPLVLDKAIATPMRELLPRPACFLDFDGSDSDSSDPDPGTAHRNASSPLPSIRRHRSESNTPTPLTRYRSDCRERGRRQRSNSSDSGLDRVPSPASLSQSQKRWHGHTLNAGLSLRSADHKTASRLSVTSPDTDRTEASSVTIPKAANGKARRILAPETPGLPLATISMRADANFLDRNKEH
jgi:hypothetical protein